MDQPITHEREVEPGQGWNEISVLYDCPQCGWWFYQNEAMRLAPSEQYAVANELSFAAVLRKYAVADYDIPLQSLRNTVSKNPEYLYQIHPTNLERLVASVFHDYFDCEVRHVGGSNDGGVDLILIRGDKEVLVQVKRRQHPHHVESVSLIRELIGAMVLSQVNSAIFVSTAEAFSPSARMASTKARVLGAAESISLVDYKRFVDMMQLCSTSQRKVWEPLLPELDRTPFA